MLLSSGLEKWSWSTTQQQGQRRFRGWATFKDFEQAFCVLIKDSPINRIHFHHQLYSNWSWIARKSWDETFFEAMEEKLNDDCIREIFNHMDLYHLIYLAHVNEFKVIAIEKLSRLRIFPSTVGSIGLSNFRYLLQMIGDSLKELSVSLNAFPSTFGFYFDHIKRYILQIIYSYTGIRLKKIYFYDFNLTESENRQFDHLFRLISQRGIQLILI